MLASSSGQKSSTQLPALCWHHSPFGSVSVFSHCFQAVVGEQETYNNDITNVINVSLW